MTGPTLERVADAAILATMTWPAWASCTSVAFWRAFPGLAWRLLAVLVLCLAAVAGVAAVAPLGLLRVMVIVALVVLVGLHWHARVARGRARRWPPGSLRLLPLGPWFERNFFLDASRRFGSVFKTSQFVRPMVCLVGLPEGLGFIKMHEESLASPPMGFGRFIPGGFLRHMPPERHAVAKDAFRRAIAREVYQPFEPIFRATFRVMAAGMAAGAGASRGDGVPPRRHIQRAMFPLWARLFFNIETGTQDETEMIRMTEADFDFETLRECPSVFIRAFTRFYIDRSSVSRLRPTAALEEQIRRQVDLFSEHMVGVHIRRTDNAKSVGVSTTALFLADMSAEMARQPLTHFFLSTDDPAEESTLREQFPGRVLTRPKRTLDRNQPAAIQDALIDLYCLSHTSKVLGSYASSFSRMAATLGNRELVLIGASGVNTTASRP